MALGVALYWTGEAGQAHLSLSHTFSRLENRHLAQLDPEQVLVSEAWRLAVGIEVDRIRELVDPVLDELRAAGALGLLPWAPYVLVCLLLRDGEWVRAYAAAGEGARIASDVGYVVLRRWLLAPLALIEAMQGREQECRAHVDEARALIAGSELAQPPGLRRSARAARARARAARTGAGHLEAATAVRTDDGTGAGRRLARPSLGDLVEAHLRSAGTVPPELMAAVARASEGDFLGFAAVAERCHGVIARDDDFDAHFERALELHGSAWPSLRARTQLCYGERRRRAGRRVDARVQLRAALETFERDGARPWAERASDELRATGERIAPRDPTATEQLTPQELQIALTVARGATNREAGAALSLGDDCYQGVAGLAAAGAAQGRWHVVRVGVEDTPRWLELTADADLLWLESPSNPLLAVADLPTICAAPRKADALIVVDSTFATPLVQRPLELGADLVIHSATKYLGGHSDLLPGAVVAASDERARRLRERRELAGATPGALEAHLAVRGMRTLALRLQRASATAAELAERLAAHPA